jgi:hypothetical protein
MADHSTSPTSPTSSSIEPLDESPPRDEVTPLLNHFFALSRPIADACREPGLDMQLSDPAHFLSIVDALEVLGYDGIEQTLLMFLDEFSQLEQRSYDELYLWSIVELSRRNLDYVDSFWPQALTLDLRFRAASWQRRTAAVFEQPYRLTELVMFYYVVFTHDPEPDPDLPMEGEGDAEGNGTPPRRGYPPLATCLGRIVSQLSEEQGGLLRESLRELARQERHPAFGDALGLLCRRPSVAVEAR